MPKNITSKIQSCVPHWIDIRPYPFTAHWHWADVQILIVGSVDTCAARKSDTASYMLTPSFCASRFWLSDPSVWHGAVLDLADGCSKDCRRSISLSQSCVSVCVRPSWRGARNVTNTHGCCPPLRCLRNVSLWCWHWEVRLCWNLEPNNCLGICVG
jgi:hypothetical protein